MNDLSITDEMWKIEKIYNGETYAQFYKKYAGVKNICLQNDWAGSIRKSCEAYKQKVGGKILEVVKVQIIHKVCS